MLACTASWSTEERFPFLPFFLPPPFSASGPKVRTGAARSLPGRPGIPGREGPPGREGAAGALLLKTGLGPRLGGDVGRWTRGGMNGARVGGAAGAELTNTGASG